MVDTLDFSDRNFNIIPLFNAFFIVISAAFLAIISSIYLSKKMLTSKSFGHLALESSQKASAGFTISEETYVDVIGKEGVAHTVLRPAGKVVIDKEFYDATAMTGYIEKGRTVKVIKYETSQIFVMEVK